jgi:regulator of protease activity HflC (stomatin/prohibitin superfamily)
MIDDDVVLVNEVKSNLMCPSPMVACGSIFCPLILCGCVTVNVKEEKVLLSMGKYIGTLRNPGCYCVNPFCLTMRSIPTVQKAVELQNVKVADGKGNPVVVSGVVTYRVVNSKKAALDVDSYSQFVITQGLTVMKRVASMYPYEAKEGQHSLKSEAEELRGLLIKLLQERLESAGLQVINFEFNDLAYSPEIAQAMLVRQQAEAVVDARKLIAEGAVEIVAETIKGLEANNISMSDQEKCRMASNLVVAICSEGGASPVVNVGNS